MFDIRENLKKLPDSPGVYMHKDRLGNVIYVGKAVNLRNRVRQYFQSQKNMAPKVRSMVSQIAEFEYITVDSEMEALILECNLIKKHRPKYNILLRDDKTYPYIKVTNEEWPRVIKTRIVNKDGGQYFGPYSDAGAVNRIVDLLNTSFSLKRCSTVAFAKGFRPCLNYHIGQCRGVCTGLASKEEYDEAVRGALDFLRGHDSSLMTSLKQKMKAASEEMRYEDAAEFRDDIEAAKALSETQRVVLHHASEADIVMSFRDANGNSFVVVFNVREGKLVGREAFRMDVADSIEETDAHVLSAFMRQHYSELPNVPKEILVGRSPEDRELLEEYLSDQAGHNVRILKPERGEKRALVKLAQADVKEFARTIEDRAKADAQRRESLGQQIWNVLSAMGACEGEYDGREFRAEAYDISNTNGVDTVGAMVVYKGLKPDRQSYRKFKVRTVRGQDDYASMKEVLSRRFMRVFSGDDKFAVLPDIIFMDGGKGHVSTALEVIDATGFEIPVAGMVKDDHHRTRALVFRVPKRDGEAEEEWREIELADLPLLYRYLGSMQEEVHRFAIEYHRKLRSRNVEKSVLDEIDGIGPKRRKALLEKFGSVEEIRRIAEKGGAEAAEELAKAEGMSLPAAENVVEFFRM
ncbi:MAG: excinuclease ABC subunit UvrC [Clostridia bacterium]|nr:excinuclease ABC subunit UvrC [Clostridia bacterium]